jgi:hypothetical protein
MWTGLEHLVTGKCDKIQVEVKKNKYYGGMKRKVNSGNVFCSL